jgi:recombination protein RecA
MAKKTTNKKVTHSLNDIKKEINRLHGDNALVTLDEIDLDTPRIPTGILSVDHILGGGLPKGKIAIASGREGGGKSAIGLMLAGQAQKEGKVVYIDLENSFDVVKAENSGIDLDELFVSQPGSAEDTLEVIEMCLSADDVSAIIVDSVAAMMTEAQINGDYSDAHVAGLARVMSLGMGKINQFMVENHKETVLFFINQIRDIIGGYGAGPTTTTPGGRALKFYASTLMEVSRIENLKEGDRVVGQKSQVMLRKSRFSPPFQKANFDIYFDKGISNEGMVIDEAINLGRISKAGGGWMTDTVTGEKLGQGKNNVMTMLEENPEYFQELQDWVFENSR